MKILISEKLSEHKYKTPEGYLICTDAILARTGKQTYTKDEVFGDGDNSEIDIDRPYDQVMNEKTIASFENKPVTFDHPEEDVNVGNYKDYAIGYVRDVHQGKVNGQDVILGNLVITDQDAINAIENGEHTDLSCGYDCDIKDDGNGHYAQNNIRGNHVALCKEGRAGMARIVDSKINDISWSWDSLETFIFKNYKNGPVHSEVDEDVLDGFDSRLDAVKLADFLEKKAHISKTDVVRTRWGYGVKVYGINDSINDSIEDATKDADTISYKYAYHATKSEQSRNDILKNGFKTSSVFVSEDKYDAEGYGKYLLKIDISKLKLYELTKEDLNNSNFSRKNGYDGIIYRYSSSRPYNAEIFNISKLNSCHIEAAGERNTKDSKETTMSDAIKILNVVDAYKKVKDVSTDKWVIKNTGLAYEVWNQGKMVKNFPTKKQAIEWIQDRFPGDKIVAKDAAPNVDEELFYKITKIYRFNKPKTKNAFQFIIDEYHVNKETAFQLAVYWDLRKEFNSLVFNKK